MNPYPKIESLSPGFDYDDEGDSEAIRRNVEMEADPSMRLTLEELNCAEGR